MRLNPSPLLNDISPACPCTGHCTTALGDDVCRSCLRTLEEVTRWPEMSDEERCTVNRRIALGYGGQSAS